jgi:hypothetical protein
MATNSQAKSSNHLLAQQLIDLTFAFRRVVQALENISAPYVVVGSTAASAWGVARTTRDIDVVAIITSETVDAFLRALGNNEIYVPADEAKAATINGGSFKVLHTTTGGKVDVFVCLASDAFESSRLDRRVKLKVLGVDTWVSTPEDVVLSKLLWRAETRSEVQWRDCVEIAASQKLDLDYLRYWASHLGVSADVDDLIKT